MPRSPASNLGGGGQDLPRDNTAFQLLPRHAIEEGPVLLFVLSSRSLLEGGVAVTPATCKARFAASPRATSRDVFQIKRD